jgi:uracil phosphoribosyltransferase
VAQVFVSRHPLVRHKLASLRLTATGPPEFRALVRSLASLLGQEATTDLNLRHFDVTTPLGPAACETLAETVGIVPILRAGLGMAEGLLDLLPEAQVWHLGIFRDENTLLPIEYYNKLPRPCRISLALVVDPMLATGGSAARACEVLASVGVPRIKLVSLIAAPEGIERVSRSMPGVPIHVGAVDERLNEVGYIVPGLGDAGDRQFHTFSP